MGFFGARGVDKERRREKERERKMPVCCSELLLCHPPDVGLGKRARSAMQYRCRRREGRASANPALSMGHCNAKYNAVVSPEKKEVSNYYYARAKASTDCGRFNHRVSSDTSFHPLFSHERTPFCSSSGPDSHQQKYKNTSKAKTIKRAKV